MKFDNLKGLSKKKFRRITGVKRATFDRMVDIVQKAFDKKKKEQTAPGGRNPKLSVEDHILMTLEYLREYRTYFHIGVSYGLSETRAFENIRWIEDVLIKSRTFSLPGKKALVRSNSGELETILIDATESPVERPKKNSVGSIPARKNGIQ